MLLFMCMCRVLAPLKRRYKNSCNSCNALLCFYTRPINKRTINVISNNLENSYNSNNDTSLVVTVIVIIEIMIVVIVTVKEEEAIVVIISNI